jgi:hypothetical protein
MEFINHTPFPAIAYAGVDQHAQLFHLVALRQTLSFAAGAPAYADVQAPLCESDLPLDETSPRAGLRQESDLCPYKPRCDVLVDATAYAPGGQPLPHFDVHLTVTRPGTPDQILIDKALRISGPRTFTRRGFAGNALRQLLRAASAGLCSPTPWTLGAARPILTLPLRPCHAYGGEYRIDAGDAAARRVPLKLRLGDEALANHPDARAAPAGLPVLHAVCDANPAGTGLPDAACFHATGRRSIAAPQIEDAAALFNARTFCQALKHGVSAPFTTPACEPAGFGPRPKSHPARRAFIGTIDQVFIDGGAALPPDFDFAFWNAAPPDQQTDYWQGDEIIELVNLCSADTPGANIDAQGNTRLRLALPAHECFLLCRHRDGTLFRHALVIDTVLVEPEWRTLTLVWRAALPRTLALRACEARMWTHTQRDRAQPDAAAFAGSLDAIHEARSALEEAP